jgi:hypothetical protein
MSLAAPAEASEHLVIALPLEPESAARARAAVSSLRPQARSSAFDDVVLLVSELVCDALAVRPRPGDAAIKLEADVLDGSAWVMVRFEGLALRLSAEKPAPSESGWGVYLVQTLATRWGAGRSAGGCYVWFEA